MGLGGSSSIGFTLPWSAILGGKCDDDRVSGAIDYTARKIILTVLSVCKPAQGCDVKIATPQGLDILANDSN